jgi:hypothetical protein
MHQEPPPEPEQDGTLECGDSSRLLTSDLAIPPCRGHRPRRFSVNSELKEKQANRLTFTSI